MRKKTVRRRRRRNYGGGYTPRVRATNARKRRVRRKRNYGGGYTPRVKARNARKRRSRTRRNPSTYMPNPVSIKGAVKGLRQTLTSPETWVQFGVGAGSFVVSSTLGGFVAGKVAGMTGSRMLIPGSFGGMLLHAVGTVAVGLGIGTFIPAKYKRAWIMGAGIAAVKPVIDYGFAATGIDKFLGGFKGMGTWLTTYDARQLGRAGVGSWLTVRDAARLGMAV